MARTRKQPPEPIIVISRPELTEEERARRMKAICDAAAVMVRNYCSLREGRIAEGAATDEEARAYMEWKKRAIVPG